MQPNKLKKATKESTTSMTWYTPVHKEDFFLIYNDISNYITDQILIIPLTFVKHLNYNELLYQPQTFSVIKEIMFNSKPLRNHYLLYFYKLGT